jgi:hypothetical protein
VPRFGGLWFRDWALVRKWAGSAVPMLFGKCGTMTNQRRVEGAQEV